MGNKSRVVDSLLKHGTLKESSPLTSEHVHGDNNKLSRDAGNGQLKDLNAIETE